MTRLVTDDIYNISSTLSDYNSDLKQKVGATLAEIAKHAVEIEGRILPDYNTIANIKVGVVPVTSGQGIIPCFSESVCSILKFLGFSAFVTKNADVSGIAEAIDSNSKILFLADDNRFIAINLIRNRMVDNAFATALGYVAALDLMTGGVKDREVFLIGAGKVGTFAAMTLLKLNCNVLVYDINKNASEKLVKKLCENFKNEIRIVNDLKSGLQNSNLIFDASPGKEFIKKDNITSKTLIVAPGMPLGVESTILVHMPKNIIHDPLQIGVATMIYSVISAD